MTIGPWRIPSAWRWAAMGDVAEIVGGGTPSTKRPELFAGDIPWITPADLSGYADKLIARGARCLSQEGLDNSGARLMPGGAVLFSSRAPIGYVAIAANPVATNQGFKSFVLRGDVLADYIYYYLRHAKKLALALASGTTFLELSGKKAAQIPVPVPPLPQQRELVAEIEKQFTRLDAGVAALKRAQANIKRYRATVLKAACEGRLVPTEAEIARREGRSYETGGELLLHILKVRREAWEAAWSHYSKKYLEPKPMAPSQDFPALPQGWTWATAEQCTKRITDGEHLTPRRDKSGVLLLSARNILNGRLSLAEVDYVPPDEYTRIAKRLVVNPGDVLLSCSGSVGRSTIAPEGLVFALVRSVAVLQPLAGMGRYLSIALRSPVVQIQISANTTQTAQANIFQGRIKTLRIPLPPLAEQQRIVAEVERRLSVADEIEATVAANLQRATRLRQAVLHSAFSGRLADGQVSA